MEQILGILGIFGALIVGLFFKNKISLNKIFKKQDKELQNSEKKIEEARNELNKAIEASKELNKPVEDLTDEEVTEYWKKKLQ